MNLYCYLDAWIIKKGFWIRYKPMRKFQKVIRIETQTYGYKFYLEPFGELNNIKSVSTGRNDSIECKYKRVAYKKYPDETYADFNL